MWIYWLRILLIAGVIVATVFLIRKKCKKKPLRKWLIIGACIVLVVAINFVPFEQFFLRADTPEELFRQITPYQSVQKVIHGADSCMLIFQGDNQRYESVFYLKTKDGYRTANVVPWVTVAKSSLSEGGFDIIRVTGTNDYYLSGTPSSKEELTVTDNLGSQFQVFQSESDGRHYYYVAAYLKGFSENYELYLNENKVALEFSS